MHHDPRPANAKSCADASVPMASCDLCESAADAGQGSARGVPLQNSPELQPEPSPGLPADDVIESPLPKTAPESAGKLTLDLKACPVVSAGAQIGAQDPHVTVCGSAEPAEAPLQDVSASVEPPTGDTEGSLRGTLPGEASQVRFDGAQLMAPVVPGIESPDTSLKPGPQVASQDDAAAESPESKEDSIPAQMDLQGDGANPGSANAAIAMEAALAGMGASFEITAPNSASRGNTKETQQNHRPMQASVSEISLPEEAKNSINVPVVRDPFPPGTVLIRRLANAESGQDGSTQTCGETPIPSNTAPASKPGEQPTGSQNIEESIYADLQSSARIPVQNPFARVNTSDTSLPQTSPSAPGKSLADSTIWAGGSEAPIQTGASDLKALAALLAPKQSAPAQPADFLSQLTERIQAQLRDGEDVIRIQLKPSSLGRMEIRAETSSAGVIATIVTESAGVKSYLEHNLHLLQQSFQDQGLKVDRINVAVQDGDWSQHSGSGQQESRSGTGNRGESKSAGWHSGLTDHSGEEITLDPAIQAVLRPHSTFHTVA